MTSYQHSKYHQYLRHVSRASDQPASTLHVVKSTVLNPEVPPGLQGAPSDLARAAGGALGHGGGVRHVVSQVEEGSSADQVAVIEADGGGEDLGVAAQQGALPPALTLDPAAVNVAAAATNMMGRDVRQRQRTTGLVPLK